MRPLMKRRIDDLELQFSRAVGAKSPGDLVALLNELQHRSSSRAKRLKEKVAQALRETTNLRPQEAGPGPIWEGATAKPAVVSERPATPPTSPLPPAAPPAAASTRSRDSLAAAPRTLAPPARPRIDDPRQAPFRAAPPTTTPNRPIDALSATRLLQAWTALEVLQPQTYRRPLDFCDGDRSRLVKIGRDGDLPWNRGDRSRENYQLYYHVVIGAIAMGAATEALLEAFDDDDPNGRAQDGFAAIAILTTDRKGILLHPRALSISSFAWGLHMALEQKFKVLGDWPRIEPVLIKAAEAIVRRHDEDGKDIPLDCQTIRKLGDSLIEKLRIPEACIAREDFILRVFHWYRSPAPPDPPPLGSFFIDDLVRATARVERGDQPELLSRYLGMKAVPRHIDLRKDEPALAEALAPGKMPAAAWPTAAAHSPSVLQQAAVSLALRGGDETRLLPVNGPPGTGKTTLLRDIVAGLVVDRAAAMASFDIPAQAFAKRRDGRRIDPRLRGFEIVVASTNNKAVENVSAALPERGAIGDQAELTYFKTVSDNVMAGPKPKGGPAAPTLFDGQGPSTDSWGLIAAVLGNGANRSAFYRAAWTDDDCGLQTYLLAAAGIPQEIQIRDKSTGRIIEARPPRVVLAERPPDSPEAALRAWNEARSAFRRSLAAVEQRLALLERGRRALGDASSKTPLALARERVSILRDKRKRAITEKDVCDARSAHATAELAKCRSAEAVHDGSRPAWLGRMFGTAERAAWFDAHARIVKAVREATASLDDARRLDAAASSTVRAAERELGSAEREAAMLAPASNAGSLALEAAARLAGDRFVDAAFFDRAYADIHRDTAWIDATTQRLRQDLFVSAMRLHKAFVDAAAAPIAHRLGVLFKCFFGKGGWSAAHRPHMADLWATFFCVVPVVSTTFASVDRMMGYLGDDAIGWLLIDEAGQAIPQAAVGGIMRAKRAVVVGDPLQLPPVTTLPETLAAKIAANFDVDVRRFIAPAASAQGLADASSIHGTAIGTADRPRRVGVPLIVHRRCWEPMFSISNKIAYDGMMVQGRASGASRIREVLGPSRWIDVKPDRIVDKWSVAEGIAVAKLLRRLAVAKIAAPELYIISPYRIVVHELRAMVLRDRLASTWTDDPDRWVRERIGTVYTVQGREADSVILVLGAADPERRGARMWAGTAPNQLNVAVTRAKENLYVVGHAFEWASAGVFAHLESSLP